ncbi:chalcone isomerase [Tanacetum coccineum]
MAAEAVNCPAKREKENISEMDMKFGDSGIQEKGGRRGTTMDMASFPSMEFESVVFPSSFKPPSATKTLVYAGVGPFEKLIHVTLFVPSMGKFFTKVATEKIVKVWKDNGTYDDVNAATIEKYHNAFKDENLLPGNSVMYIILSNGSVALNVVKDGIIPEAPLAVLENTKMGSTLIKAMLQKDEGSIPEARESVALRLSGFFN